MRFNKYTDLVFVVVLGVAGADEKVGPRIAGPGSALYTGGTRLAAVREFRFWHTLQPE